MTAMGVTRDLLPSWDSVQFVTAQLASLPLLDDMPVGTDVLIGPVADRPLRLELPLFVSDMSFGALTLGPITGRGRHTGCAASSATADRAWPVRRFLPAWGACTAAPRIPAASP